MICESGELLCFWSAKRVNTVVLNGSISMLYVYANIVVLRKLSIYYAQVQYLATTGTAVLVLISFTSAVLGSAPHP